MREISLAMFLEIQSDIYTRFQKGFHIKRDREIYTFVFLHVCPCAFFTFYCPTCQKTRFNDKFSLRQVLCSSSLKKEKECADIVSNPLDLHTLEN